MVTHVRPYPGRTWVFRDFGAGHGLGRTWVIRPGSGGTWVGPGRIRVRIWNGGRIGSGSGSDAAEGGNL